MTIKELEMDLVDRGSSDGGGSLGPLDNHSGKGSPNRGSGVNLKVDLAKPIKLPEIGPRKGSVNKPVITAAPIHRHKKNKLKSESRRHIGPIQDILEVP